MGFCENILLILLLVVVTLVIFNNVEREGYRSRRRRHIQSLGGRYRHRHRHRHRRYPEERRRYFWYNPGYWFNGPCKRGCTSIGNGNWGCQYTGSGPNDCWFANDCYGCGY